MQFPTEEVPNVLQVVNPITGAIDETRRLDTGLSLKLVATLFQLDRAVGVSLGLHMARFLRAMSLLMHPFKSEIEPVLLTNPFEKVKFLG